MRGSDLMISVSGVRGIVGKSLTPELLLRLGHAFGTYLHSGRVVVGRDTRVSGEMARHAVLSGLLASGCRVLDAGVCATPTATLMVEQEKADGGIMVTASHNPIEWNALKFFRADGMYLSTDESRDLLNLYYSGQFSHAAWNELKPAERLEHVDERHVDKVLSILDCKLIRARRFRVALDCCNGAGCGIAQQLLGELGCEIETIHCKPDGLFPHKPEPVTANLQDLCGFVSRSRADVGFATDPDADRMAVVDEHGVAIGEELGLALCMRYVLSRRPVPGGTVVVNLSTSRATEDVAREAGCEVIRTPAGEVHVAEKMREVNAVFGGEGNGGIIDPRVHFGRDSIAGIGLVLEAMARSKASVRQLADQLPSYVMLKTKIDCPPAQSRSMLRRMKATLHGARLDMRDGLHVGWDDRWVQIRASNTEPIVRIIAEARTHAQAKAMIEEYTARALGSELARSEPERASRRARRIATSAA